VKVVEDLNSGGGGYLHKINFLFKKRTSYEVGNGRRVLFSHDVWLSDYPLKTILPLIFSGCEHQEKGVLMFLVDIIRMYILIGL
jgi:hypothetical protein